MFHIKKHHFEFKKHHFEFKTMTSPNKHNQHNQHRDVLQNTVDLGKVIVSARSGMLDKMPDSLKVLNDETKQTNKLIWTVQEFEIKLADSQLLYKVNERLVSSFNAFNESGILSTFRNRNKGSIFDQIQNE